MINISNYQSTSMTRTMKIGKLDMDVLSSIGSFTYTICVYDNGTEIVELRKTTTYSFSNDQLIDPTNGNRKIAQDPNNGYVGEYDYMLSNIESSGIVNSLEAKAAILDLENIL